MARKKKPEEAKAGAPEWMATFSDLMNLLLCFFVLLFSMSSTDTAKYNEIVEAVTSSFSIFSGGGSALDQGILVSSGVSQLNELAEYYSNLAVENTAKEEGTQGGSGKSDAAKNENNNANKTEDKKEEEVKKEDNKEVSKEEAVQKYKKELKDTAEKNYEKASEAINQFKLNDMVQLKMDTSYNYIGLSIDGYFLFDSGQADLKKGADAVLDKAAGVLMKFKDANIVIEGHTDNVPQTNTVKFKNNMWLSSARAMAVLEYLTDVEHMDPKKLSASGKGEYEPIATNKTAEGRQKNRRVEIKIFNKVAD
ncbi:MAG: flagellar motor protein MotB [Catonella sp.]|uniref:flagellar motor protein MotB n=1 Tax=Catonella sp. TaxID=2382125 RepID=UPI003FA03955